MSISSLGAAGGGGINRLATVSAACGKAISCRIWHHLPQGHDHNLTTATQASLNSAAAASTTHYQQPAFQLSTLTNSYWYNNIGNIARPAMCIQSSQTPHLATPTSYQIAKELPVVCKIKKQLDANKVAIIVGAPGSGKSEQVGIAVGKHHVFDLKQEFLSDYYKENNIVSKTDQNQLWNSRYYDVKHGESDWLESHYDEIKQTLLDSPEEVILLDEFDLDGSNQLSENGTKGAELIVKLAQELTAEGKKVLLIMHETGLKTPQLVNKLEATSFIHTDADIIHTEFFPRKNQEQILVGMGIAKGEKAEEIIDYTAGLPAVYLPFLQNAQQTASHGASESYQPTISEFLSKAKERVQKNINVAKKISPTAVNTLVEYLKAANTPSHQSVHIKVNRKLKKALLETGLVTGNADGTLLVPGIVRENLV